MTIITETAPRDRILKSRFIPLPSQFFPALEEYEWVFSYSVEEKDRETATGLNRQLFEALEDAVGDTENSRVQTLLEELKSLRMPSYHELTNCEKWDRVASSMPQDIAGYHKAKTSRLLTERTHGNTLEAMCGFNSYLLPKMDTQVTAQDYSKVMLMKYEFPKRKRVLFDLDLLPGQRLEFPPESFHNVVFVKGYKYVTSPIAMFSEWKRLLMPGGQLVFVESTTAGYSDIAKRQLNPHQCKDELSQVGLETTLEVLPFSDGDEEELILFTATK